MGSLSRRRIVLGCSLLWLLPVIPADGQEARAPANESYPLALHLQGRIKSVEPDGTVRIVATPVAPGAGSMATEGFYLIASPQLALGLETAVASRPPDVAPQTKGARRPPGPATSPASGPVDGLVRVEVTDVGEQDTLTARSGAEAAKVLKPGEMVVLIRPGSMTTARIRALPTVIPLLKPGDPRVPRGQRDAMANAGQAARSARSVNNLKQIGLAMHNFQATTNHIPPAVVFGPDGKPWHSWRVLLLPYLGENELYNQYDFTQPWDSPRNRALIDKMPPVYRDPQNVEATGSSTHYAALVGERTVFSPRGPRITIANGTASGDLYNGTTMAAITDGTSNTIAIVPVDPARKIPWTKPEDIAVGQDFPGLGRPGGIFTPARIGGAGVAPVLFLDGSVRTLSDRTDPATIRALTTMNGGEIITSSKVIGPSATRGPGAGRIRHLYLIGEGRDVSAMIEPASSP